MYAERHVADANLAAVVELGYPVMTLESHASGCELTLPTSVTAHQAVKRAMGVLASRVQTSDESQIWLPTERVEKLPTTGVERMLREGTVQPVAVALNAGGTEVSWIAGPDKRPNTLIISDSYLRRQMVEDLAGKTILPGYVENIHQLFEFADEQFGRELAGMKMSD